MAMLDDMKSDTSVLLDEWGESLSIDRASLSWAAGMSSETWQDKGVVVGDWQPVSGRTIQEEEGRAVKSDAVVVTLIDEDIQAGDRVYRPDSSYMYVNYIRKYEDHWTVYLTKTEPQT